MSCQVSYLNPQNLRCDLIPLIIYTSHSIDIAHSSSVKLNISQSRIAWRNPCIPSSTLSSLEPLWSGLCFIFNLVSQSFSISIVYSFLITPVISYVCSKSVYRMIFLKYLYWRWKYYIHGTSFCSQQGFTLNWKYLLTSIPDRLMSMNEQPKKATPN